MNKYLLYYLEYGDRRMIPFHLKVNVGLQACIPALRSADLKVKI